MKLEKTFIYMLSLMTMAGLSACYPVGDDITYEDVDIALTVYDKDYYSPEGDNYFKDFQTFVVPDTVIHIIEDGVEDEITREHDKYVIGQVRSNLLKLGYIEESDPDTNPPDIAVTISVTTSEHVVYDWYSYWTWFWVFIKKSGEASSSDVENNYPWYPYYGYGSSYTYTSGTLILEMVDVTLVDESTEEIPVIWAGVINGLAGGPEDGLRSRLSVGIDRCFNQSPYLFK